MKRFFQLTMALLLAVSARAALPITNNTMIITWSESLDRGQFGNRYAVFMESYYVNFYPQFTVRVRNHSRSGGSNFEMLTNREPTFGPHDWGASAGTEKVVNIYRVTSDGGFDSNSIYGYFKQILQAPTNTYNRFGVRTNDWPLPGTNFYSVVMGDIAGNAADGTPAFNAYSLGASNAAVEFGCPYVDSWHNTLFATTNGYLTGTNFWFPPSSDHPGNELHLVYALTTLTYPTNNIGLGEETNVYTAILDFNNALVANTNHCTVSSLSRSGGTLSFTFHADRFGPAFYVPDGLVTNDCRGAFQLQPALGNAFCEILRITNLPAGNYTVTLDGSNCVSTTATQLAAGFNWFTNYAGAFWAQKKEGLGLLLDMRDISRATASDDAHVGDNRLLERYESYAGVVWSTNNVSMSSYLAQSDMLARESELQAEDVLIHANAQQTNHTFSIQLNAPRLAPFHR